MPVKSLCKNVKSLFCSTEPPEPKKSSLRNSSALVSLGKKFSRDENGNIAMIFGIGSLVLFISAGLAVDFSRYNLVYGDLIESMDAAGLAIAQFEALNEDATDAELKTLGRQFFDENFRYSNLIDNLVVEFDISQTKISPRVSGSMDALILQTISVGSAKFDFNNFNMQSVTEITKKGSGRIELALVLDVTGSMDDPAEPGDSDSKMDDLKDSVDVMLGALFGDEQTSDSLKISVVPFNSTVNVGGGTNSFDDDWIDVDAEAIYHGARFIHTKYISNASEIDRSNDARATNSFSTGSFGPANSGGVIKIFDTSKKVNHLELFDSMNGVNWKGCVEERPYPLDEIDVGPDQTVSTTMVNGALTEQPITGSGLTAEKLLTKQAFDNDPSLSLPASQVAQNANLKFVPYFAPDEPNCYFSSGSTCFNVPYSIGIGYSDFSFGGVARGRTVSLKNWMSNPNDAGHTWSDYSNRSFVDDTNFAFMESSDQYKEFNEFLLGYRHATRLSHSSGSYWGDVKAKFSQLGATSANNHEHIGRQAYVGYYNEGTKTYAGRYSNAIGYSVDDSVSIASTRGPNIHCSNPILPLTDSRADIRAAVQALKPRGATNSAVGTMWGWRTLSPQAPFTEGVEYDNGQWQKAIVIMTDGENVISSRNTHERSIMTAYGTAREQRMGLGVDTASKMRTEVDRKMLRICQRMKDEGILVYTIMFGLESDNIRNLYRACASEPEPPYFYDITSGDDLENAFGDIAKDLVDLHISK